MENKELFETLAQLQKNLEDIESARKMVEKTVSAYKGGAELIKSYSNQLSKVSEKIGQLIEQIKQNKDFLSSEVDEKIKVAIKKIEQASISFSDKTKEQIDSFNEKTSKQVSDVNVSVNELISEANKSIRQSAEVGKASQDKATESLDSATSKLESTTNEIIRKNEQQFSDFKVSISKKITVFSIIIIFLMLANIIIQFIR